jgi:hypothetical protein
MASAAGNPAIWPDQPCALSKYAPEASLRFHARIRELTVPWGIAAPFCPTSPARAEGIWFQQ